MALLEVTDLSHSFGDKMLYKNSSFELFGGEHMGLVGQNGSGKTTLLNSLIGEVIPDKGEIRWQRGTNIGYLDQHAKIDDSLSIFKYLKTAFSDLYIIEEKLNKMYENMAVSMDNELFDRISNLQSVLENRGFYEIDSTILKVADGLGIVPLGMNTLLGKLSGGQRARVILAKLLLQKPDVLLLDEPTNFLDKEHVQWLTDFLRAFDGAFVVISHDFDFLDKITTCICNIEFCTIKKYGGNFSKFIELKGLKRENYIREYNAQRKQIKKYEDYISKNKVRASTAKMAKSRQKQLDRIEKIPPPEETPKPHFHFVSADMSGDIAVNVRGLEIGYYHALLPKLNFNILAGEKVVITGFNGIGKSTLLKTLIGEIPPISGSFKFAHNTKIAYFEQDLKFKDESESPIKIVSNRFPRLGEKLVRRYLAQCALKAKSVMQPISTLSGGEQAKVKLCILMLTSANMLVLDEITNHLDVDAKGVLKDELIKWGGSIILVSHEAAFYKDLADRVINIENI